MTAERCRLNVGQFRVVVLKALLGKHALKVTMHTLPNARVALVIGEEAVKDQFGRDGHWITACPMAARQHQPPARQGLQA